MSFDAIVIGAGTNGLTAAAALGKAGRRVLLLERSVAVGGMRRAIQFAPGFRAAPLGDDPGWLPPVVAGALGLAEVAPFHAAAPLTVALTPRDFLTLWADPARAAEAIRRFAPQDADRWTTFAEQINSFSGFLATVYQRQAPDPMGATRELLALSDLGWAFRRLGRADMAALLRTLPMPVQDLTDDWFGFEPLKAALAAGGVQHLHLGPRAGGTAFNLLHHLVGAPAGTIRRAGRWPGGGIVAALEQAARRLGVTIRASAAVQRIRVADDAVTGVMLDSGEEIAAPVVLSTADPKRTLLGLVDPVWLDPEFLHAVGQIKYRGCTAVVLYALDGPLELPGLADAGEAIGGTISLTARRDALERAADAAKYDRASEAPHVEIALPTLAAPQDSPEGTHVLVARVQYAPYRLRDDAWNDKRREELAKAATAAIAAVAPGFADRILHRAVLAPPDLEAEFGLTEGAAHHGAPMLDQILFMRPLPGWARYRMPIEGLYLGGAGTHPGPGIIGGPGFLAAQQVLRDSRR